MASVKRKAGVAQTVEPRIVGGSMGVRVPPPAPRNNAETLLVAEIRLALGKRTDVIMFRNSVGYDKEKHVKFGLMKGSSDLIGLVKPSGRFIALEVKLPGWKRPRNQHEREQQEFIDMIRSAGGYGAFVTSVDTAMVCVDEARIGVTRS